MDGIRQYASDTSSSSIWGEPFDPTSNELIPYYCGVSENDIEAYRVTPWMSRRRLVKAGFYREGMESQRTPYPAYNLFTMVPRASGPTYKVLWEWLRAVFFDADELPIGLAIVTIPRKVTPGIEDVYVYDGMGNKWRSKRSMSLHLKNAASGERCTCEVCVKRKDKPFAPITFRPSLVMYSRGHDCTAPTNYFY